MCYNSLYNSSYHRACEDALRLPDAFKAYNDSRGNLAAMNIAEAWIMQLAAEWPIYYNQLVGMWIVQLKDGCERTQVMAQGKTKLEAILKATRLMNVYCGV